MANIFEELSKDKGKGLEGTPSPTEKIVDWFHARVSTNRRTDVHHQIGNGATDAASGDHTHDGVNSKFLFNSAELALFDLSASPTTA